MNGTERRENDRRQYMLEDLFRQATARQQPPAEHERVVRAVLHDAWRQRISRRRGRQRFAVGIAAVLIIGLASWILWLPQSPPPAAGMPVTTVERLRGTVRLMEVGERSSLIEALSVLKSGQSLETGSSASLALRWNNGISVRIDRSSRLRLVSGTEVELESGRLYVDTREAQDASHEFLIHTPAGSVTHIGTQYMASVSAGQTRLTIRGGEIRVSSGGVAWNATGGEQLLFRDSDAPVRSNVPPHGDMWRWAESLAPPLSAANQPVSDFLGWVSHETGLALVFRSDAARAVARDTHLRGDIDREPLEALDLVLRTTDLVSVVETGTILVSLRGKNE